MAECTRKRERDRRRMKKFERGKKDGSGGPVQDNGLGDDVGCVQDVNVCPAYPFSFFTDDREKKRKKKKRICSRGILLRDDGARG